LTRDPPPSIDADILVVGAGVLGISISYWLSTIFDCKILLADTERVPGRHTSSRNTGVIHRPFYLHPRRKRTFALTSRLSYPLWKELADSYALPWKPTGTLNVALNEVEVSTLSRYKGWGAENGMADEELELLDGTAVAGLEPEVRCRAGLLAKTDVSVDFGAFTRCLQRLGASLGVTFLRGATVESVAPGSRGLEVSIVENGLRSTVRCRFLLNAAGGGALALAHRCGLAGAYSELYFRGEYWVVDQPFASRVGTNIYRPPRYPQFPFLDPHFVVRADGSRQVGPNAALVTGPYVYSGPGFKTANSLLSRPATPRFRLLADPSFLRLLAGEWRSSLSKGAMCERVRKFVPGLHKGMLTKHAVFGVRSSVVDKNGFVPEALIVRGQDSAHVLNYNSPGATGAPAYSAMVVSQLLEDGSLDGLPKRRTPVPKGLWDFENLASQL
jgi:L-2-hydroxyglutarate oxidase